MDLTEVVTGRLEATGDGGLDDEDEETTGDGLAVVLNAVGGVTVLLLGAACFGGVGVGDMMMLDCWHGWRRKDARERYKSIESIEIYGPLLLTNTTQPNNMIPSSYLD